MLLTTVAHTSIHKINFCTRQVIVPHDWKFHAHTTQHNCHIQGPAPQIRLQIQYIAIDIV